jgi:curli biogenesis system outer membrane secretion channel CsgG
MNKLMLVSLILATALPAVAQRQTLAVDKVKASTSLTADIAKDNRAIQCARIVEAMDRHLISAITSSRKFTIVGRQDLKAILDEQDLGQSGIVNQDTAAQLGEVKGAKYKLVTVVDHFQEETARAVFNENEKLKRRFQISAQATIYDTSTGEVLDASNIQVEKVDVISIDPGTSNRTGGRTDELMPLVTRELAEKTCARLIDVLFPAKIIDVDGTTITINRGEGFFAQGDVVTIFSQGKTVVDPDTGEKMAIKGKVIGTARITSVEPTNAQAELAANIIVTVGAQVKKQEPKKD